MKLHSENGETLLFGGIYGDFKKKALDKIFKDLGQPKKTDDSMFAILEGKITSDGQPFVNALLDQESMREYRLTLVQDMIVMAICDGCYDARMRVLIKHVAWQLRVTWDQVEDIESDLAEKLEYRTYVMSEEEAKEKSNTSRNRKVKRCVLIGVATVGGAALIGLTGGLSVPLVVAEAGVIISECAAGILASKAGVFIGGAATTIMASKAGATIGGGAAGELMSKAGVIIGGDAARMLASKAGSVICIGVAGIMTSKAGVIIGAGPAATLTSKAGVFVIGSLLGVAGGGLTGYKMHKLVGAVEEFSLESLTSVGSRLQPTDSVKQLHITIAVTGWLNESMNDYRLPWRGLAESREQYILVWESKYLYQLGKAFDYIVQTVISKIIDDAFQKIIQIETINQIAWPVRLLFAANLIDNPWHVCTQRATGAGNQLAEVLLSRQQGNRPVTLIGFSMGARVIFSCLEELSKRKGSEGIVQDAILLGAPVSGDPDKWKKLAKVVAGKIVNGYSRGDWLLQFVYRTLSLTFCVAGVGPIKWDDRRMHNIDLSDMIDGHMDYSKNLDKIMKRVGVRTEASHAKK